MIIYRTIAVGAATLALSYLATLAPWAYAADPITDLAPVALNLDGELLKPGLAVTYHFSKFNHIDELIGFAAVREGTVGEPLAKLDYNTGNGHVLTTDRSKLVGANINGFIQFPVPGKYMIATQSNDGIQLNIGGKLIEEDPGVHSDRFSDLIPVVIEKAGWYPLQLWYYQKKGTATLELYWLEPGKEGDLKFVPEKAFAHVAK